MFLNESHTKPFTGEISEIYNFDGLGNNPDNWLGLLETYLKLSDGPKKKKILKHFFLQVQKVIDVEQHKHNISFAKILAYEAMFLGESNVDDARDAFQLATMNLRRVPYIHIAFAQFELNQDRKEKAIKILRRGKMLNPCDKDLADALTKICNNQTNIIYKKPPSPLRNITNTSSQNSVPLETGKYNDHSSSSVFPSFCKSNFKTPSSSRSHTIAEALDLPSSPCTPELNCRTKPGLKTPVHIGRKTPIQVNRYPRTNATTFNMLNLKSPTPPRLSYSMTKSFSKRKTSSEMPPSTSSVVKTTKESTKSNHDFGKPRRVLCVKKSKDDDSDDEMEGIEALDPPGLKAEHQRKPIESPSPLVIKSCQSNTMKENPPLSNQELLTRRPPPHSVPPVSKTPHPEDSESNLPEWVLKSKILTVHHKPYIVIKELGLGGSSKVYEVLDLTSRSIKALKKVTLAGCDRVVREGFMNEIKFLTKLKGSPNIIHLHDFELVEDILYIVMECGSTDLAKFIQQHRIRQVKLETYETWYFWKKMIEAVKTIHDHGVIHLDLKPANFLIVKGNLKLIDFGIANALQADATSVIKDTQVGTLNYMAPEAIMDMSGYHSNTPRFKISPRSDVWSLGCILHLMMYGRTPFQHITHQLMKLNAITNPACSLEFDNYPDRQLSAIVQCCLQRDPKKRPTVQQLLQCKPIAFEDDSHVIPK